MPDREKVIKGMQQCLAYGDEYDKCMDCPYLQEVDCIRGMKKDALALLKEQPEIIRCKDCKHRGISEKCVIAAISEEKCVPLFMLDDRGEWFCADGKRKDGEQNG